MAVTKQRTAQHLIDHEGTQLFRSKLPKHWILREYRPDYGLDLTVEVFKAQDGGGERSTNYETLREHLIARITA
jgi:hypothetical protein